MPSTTDEKRILIKGSPLISELAAKASEAILPGHLLEIDSTNTAAKHGTEAGFHNRMVALENQLDGSGITDAYADAETVTIANCKPGDVVQMIIKDGETIAIGDFLESAGDGTLQEITAFDAGTPAPAGIPVAVALEAASPSGSTATIPVQIV